MKIVSWNVNHTASHRPIHPMLARCLAALSPDVVVLNEFVDFPTYKDRGDRDEFYKDMEEAGYSGKLISGGNHIKRQFYDNQVLVLSKSTIQTGNVPSPKMDNRDMEREEHSPATNYINVAIQKFNIDIIAFRVPYFIKKQANSFLSYWDAFLYNISDIETGRMLFLGDFNVDIFGVNGSGSRDWRKKVQAKIEAMKTKGWHYHKPKGDFSYRGISGDGSCLDHAVLGNQVQYVHSEYLFEVDGMPVWGAKKDGISDHLPLLLEIE